MRSDASCRCSRLMTKLSNLLDRSPGRGDKRGPIPRFVPLSSSLPFSHGVQLRDCIQKTLNEWSSQISPDLIREFPDVLECTVSHAVEKINPDEREEMKVSAKLFIVGSNSSSSTRNAVDMACSVLGVAQLDSVIIASPPIEDGVNLSLEHLQPYWEELQNLVQSKKIVAIGTSDLDKTQLEQLYQWAQNCFLKQVSKKHFRRASLTFEHMSGCLCGYCGTRSLLKVEELSNQKATSYKLKERVPNCSLGP
uniref:GCS light chain n=1 Tax=Capra hircus TaxID=9925 RepID=A0A8C2R792_CAPHI